MTVGACVMLRHNIDIRAGLVNGAIGTVLSITPDVIKVNLTRLVSPM